MKMAKKFLAVALAGVLALSVLTGCGASVKSKDIADSLTKMGMNVEQSDDMDKTAKSTLTAIEAIIASDTNTAAAAGDNSCGENVTWTLADGTLTISGTGRMTNFTSDSPAPWADQADQITNVEVEGTVTSIGAVAFKGCTNLTTVNIADGVEYIEAGAFNGCTALTDITIPESVGYIKTGAFKDCNALTSVTIRDNCRLDMNVFPTTVEVNHSEG